MVKTKEHSPPLRLWISALVLGLLGGFHFGYHLVLTNPSENRWSIYVSLLYFGSFFGAFFIQPTADRLGRKYAVLISSSGQALAVAVSMLSYFVDSHILYAFSRFMLGFFQAITVGITPMYISECSPPSCRGIISLSTALLVHVSIIFSSILASPQILGTITLWWILYLFEFIVFVIAIGGLLLLPESPSYLHARGDANGASQSLSFYRGISGCELDKALETMSNVSANSTNAVGLLRLVRDSETRGRAFTGSVVMFSALTSGNAVINAYAFSIFLTVGLDRTVASWACVGIAAIMVLGVGLSTVVIERFGRRPLLLITLSCILVINCTIVTLMFLFQLDQTPIYSILLIAVICLFSLVFAMGKELI